MLLMIELFMGDYKGVGNDSAQEFHWTPEKVEKVEQDAGVGLQELPRAGEEHKHEGLRGHPALMEPLRPQAAGTPRARWHCWVPGGVAALQELGVHRNMLSYLLDLYIEFGGWAFWGFVF